jgi:anti-sigma-K factor RskA
MKCSLKACVAISIMMVLMLGMVPAASSSAAHVKSKDFHSECAAVVIDARTGESVLAVVSDTVIQEKALTMLAIEKARDFFANDERSPIRPIHQGSGAGNP